MRYLIPLIALILMTCPARAQQPSPPTTQGDIPALIKQLGSDVPKEREAATAALRKLGKSAVPAIKEAANDPDLEVASRAQLLLKLIEADATPQRPLGRFGGPLGEGDIRLRTTVRGGGFQSVSVSRGTDGQVVREATIGEPGHVTAVREDKDGITVTTTDGAGDKEKQEIVKAKDAETLKKEHPDAYARYLQVAQKAAPVRGGIVGGGGITPDDRARLARALEDARLRTEEMRRMAEEQHRKAVEEMRELRKRLEENADRDDAQDK